ncbi:hypothetical protein JKP88DRAFT_266401 [Tribonema minus]|uniref:Pentacotripeptide-repeat region of PRORP domain-containing protein n=1 Tax=Tribonema minus TaxID=303371 RepID=A0A835ZF41_9STRA|nr:hypothetical protein JKP88DRAFT_266401 [Tribonema minus]
MAMRKRPQPIRDEQQLLRAIQKLGRDQDWQQAMDVFARGRQAGIRMSLRVYSGALTALARSGRWREATALLEEALADGGSGGSSGGGGIAPDAALFTAAISACEEDAQWESAVRLLSAARAAGVEPDALMLAKVATVCARARAWEECLAALTEMREARGLGAAGEPYDEAVEACMNGGPVDRVRAWLADALRAPLADKRRAREERAAAAAAARARRRKASLARAIDGGGGGGDGGDSAEGGGDGGEGGEDAAAVPAR